MMLCKQQKKRKFKTEKGAEDFADKWWCRDEYILKMPLRVYKCRECPFFHLTSQPDR
jgi:hypothetical protein